MKISVNLIVRLLMCDSFLNFEEISTELVVESKMVNFDRTDTAKEVAIQRSLLPRILGCPTAQILSVQDYDYIGDSNYCETVFHVQQF